MNKKRNINLSNVKSFLKRRLPKRLVIKIKKIRYAKVTKSISEQSSPEFKIIRSLVKDGDFVIDLGANIGFFTKYLSDIVGAEGRVYSFEPIPETFEILKYIAKKLRLTNVQLFNFAVSDAESIVTMEIPIDTNDEENFYESKIIPMQASSTYRTQIIQAKTLDKFSQSFGHISFIKCDVEGHEYPALLGASAILENSRPSLLVEIWGDLDEPQSSASRTAKFLERYGYRVYWLDGTTLRERRSSEKSTNYFFLTKDHLLMLQNCTAFKLNNKEGLD